MVKLYSKNIAFIGIIAIGAMAFVGGCTTPSGKKLYEDNHHNHSHQLPPEQPAPLPPYAQPVPNTVYVPSPKPAFVATTTNLAGCVGDYTLTDSRSGKLLSYGRAYNDVSGVYVLDKNGRKTGNVLNAISGQSILFKPDCNCDCGTKK